MFGGGIAESTPTVGNKGASGTSSPGSEGEVARGGRRGRGRGTLHTTIQANTPSSSMGRGSTEGQMPNRSLYDPTGSTPKPANTTMARRVGLGSGSASPAPRAEDQVFRMPRGPVGDGRGGFGFANRGAKAG